MDSTHKAMKYHYKIQNELHNMIDQGKQIPNGYESYLKPFNQQDGGSGKISENRNIDFRDKSMKYHYKIQNKLHSIMENGGQIPDGYANYLEPFE